MVDTNNVYKGGKGWYYRALTYKSDHMREWGPYNYERHAISALKSHEYHRHWSKIWQRAIANMPYRIVHDQIWRFADKGTTPIPVLIKGLAKGTHKQSGDRILYLDRRPRKCGQKVIIGHLLDYKTKHRSKGRVIVNTLAINSKIDLGHKPREAWKRDLLIRLANPTEGKALAWKMADERGLIKRWHRRPE